MMRVYKMKDAYYCEFITHKVSGRKETLKSL